MPKKMKNALKILLLTSIFCLNIKAQMGCTDSYATNYNAAATINNGSCIYNSVSVTPTNSTVLSNVINETSGLIEWENFLYTHNDNTDTSLYKINKTTGGIVQSIVINGITNVDWEEIAQDENFIYIGDFGNNVSGNRTNLKIYKISKSTLTTTPIIETINFTYSNQTDFTAQTANNTNFDCEAFIVTDTEILLFTKQWVTNQTSIYSLPKNTGTHIANLITTLNVSGLLTGATLKKDIRLIALSGYDSTLKPFIYLIYDYYGTNFALANKRKIEITLPFHQVEGISTTNGTDYFITNESFIQSPFINNPQKLHTLNISNFINNYINSLSNKNFINEKTIITTFPNPTTGEIYFDLTDIINKTYQIRNINGQVIQSDIFRENKINIANFETGVYLLSIENNPNIIKIMKK